MRAIVHLHTQPILYTNNKIPSTGTFKMPASLTKANPKTGRKLSQDQMNYIWYLWFEGAPLWTAVVSNLMNSAYKAHPGGFLFANKIDFDGTDGFAVRDTDMRATVKLTTDPSDTYATVEVATSWQLTPWQKLALEADKARVLAKGMKGEDLSGFVDMSYTTCEPSAKKKQEDKLTENTM